MKESITLDPLLEHEYRELLSRVYDRVTDPSSDSFPAAVALADHVREEASRMAIDAGGGDRFDDPAALVAIVGLVLMTSVDRMSDRAIEERVPSNNE